MSMKNQQNARILHDNWPKTVSLFFLGGGGLPGTCPLSLPVSYAYLSVREETKNDYAKNVKNVTAVTYVGLYGLNF